MSDNQDIKALQKEVKELRKTVYSLKDTIVGLTNQIETGSSESPYEGGQYNIFPNRSNCLEGDASWDRLVTLLHNEDSGLTAAELAEDGQIIKYRDGRMIRFRSADE